MKESTNLVCQIEEENAIQEIINQFMFFWNKLSVPFNIIMTMLSAHECIVITFILRGRWLTQNNATCIKFQKEGPLECLFYFPNFEYSLNHGINKDGPQINN